MFIHSSYRNNSETTYITLLLSYHVCSMLDARDFHFATVETVLDYVHNEINCFIDHENTFA